MESGRIILRILSRRSCYWCAHIIDDCVKDIVLLLDDRREFYEKEVLAAIEDFFKKYNKDVIKIIPHTQSLDFYLENGYRTEGYYILRR